MNIEDVLSRIIIGAIDPDWRIFQGKILDSLAREPRSGAIREWVSRNPLLFEALVRSLSAAAHALPKDTLFKEKITDVAKQAAADLKAAVEADQHVPVQIIDNGFRERFEAAVEPLDDEDLRKVARLNQQDLRKWVEAPTKLRPALLETMSGPSELVRTLNEAAGGLRPHIQDLTKRLREINDREKKG